MYILTFPNRQNIRTCIRAEQYSSQRSPSTQSKRLFIYDLSTLFSPTVTDESLAKTCPGVAVLSFHWPGTQQTWPSPKILGHVTDHVVDERAISIFLL